jgi:hypothetical protein
LLWQIWELRKKRQKKGKNLHKGWTYNKEVKYAMKYLNETLIHMIKVNNGGLECTLKIWCKVIFHIIVHNQLENNGLCYKRL